MSDIPKLNSIVPVHLGTLDEPTDIVKRAAVVRAVLYLNRTKFAKEHQANYLVHAFDSASGRDVIKVLDRRTEELLYQIPSDEVLRMAAETRRSQAKCGSTAADGDCGES